MVCKVDCHNAGIHGGNRVIYSVNMPLAGGKMGMHGGNSGIHCGIGSDL